MRSWRFLQAIQVVADRSQVDFEYQSEWTSISNFTDHDGGVGCMGFFFIKSNKKTVDFISHVIQTFETAPLMDDQKSEYAFSRLAVSSPVVLAIANEAINMSSDVRCDPRNEVIGPSEVYSETIHRVNPDIGIVAGPSPADVVSSFTVFSRLRLGKRPGWICAKLGGLWTRIASGTDRRPRKLDGRRKRQKAGVDQSWYVGVERRSFCRRPREFSDRCSGFEQRNQELVG